MSKSEWVTLRVMTVNVHMGQGLLSSAVAWLLQKFPGLDIIFLQEVSRPPARRALHRLFPAARWIKAGPKNQEKDPLVGTFAVARRSRFDRERRVNRRVTKSRPQVHGKDMFPQRNLNALVLKDKKSGREIVASSIHNWHIVGRELGGKGPVMRGHVRQTRSIAAYHGRTFVDGQVHLSGGDTNEDLDSQMQSHPDSFTSIMREEGHMVPSYRSAPAGSKAVHLDDIFFRPTPYIQVKRRIVIPAFGKLDHPVVVTVFRVRRQVI